MTAVQQAVHLEVRGVVQGVGFRPFVYRLAHELGLQGWVRNTSWGVEIQVSGQEAALGAFQEALRQQAPPLARIEAIRAETVLRPLQATRFEILESQAQAGAYQLISPDIATCPDCLREIWDSSDRRYRYPFTNCTHCGPRFTIIQGVPYDRPRTTMRPFVMCPQCQREYDDPLDRRFHAQPNACPLCGPHLTLCDAYGTLLAEGDAALRQAEARLSGGGIVALKGLGGFQLACDATNAEAVQRLRWRKHRPHKPFAVMVPDVEMVSRYARLDEHERRLLTSSAAPILLLRQGSEATLPEVVAPHSDIIGMMLPYTPLHHLLLGDLRLPLVMTSGNLSEEPIAYENQEALRRLSGIADVFLLHNRDIHARYDDSVWFITGGESQAVRRARGYAPFPLRLPVQTRPILACGPQLKNTLCLTRGEYAFLSQHIGDMENLETEAFWEQVRTHYSGLFEIAPQVVATDMHPDYAATRLGRQLGGKQVAVQHHHAHFVACLTDNGIVAPAIGVILDGTGYGLDGRIWGGEFLVGDGRGFQRAAHLQYLPLPGGEAAIHRPARIAWAYLRTLLPERMGEVALGLSDKECEALDAMMARGVVTPLTSSAGRLFDAASALLGVCRETSYEAQAAIELEAVARLSGAPQAKGERALYSFDLVVEGAPQVWGRPPVALDESLSLGVRPLLVGLLDDLQRGCPSGEIAWRFHSAIAALVVETCRRLATATGLSLVALSGGCFQNRLLLELTVRQLRAAGLSALTHRQAPCNDGGVALGQAMVAHYASEGD